MLSHNYFVIKGKINAWMRHNNRRMLINVIELLSLNTLQPVDPFKIGEYKETLIWSKQEDE